MSGNNPNNSIYNTNTYNSDPGSVNGSSKPRLSIRIPYGNNGNNGNNGKNMNAVDNIIDDIEVAAYELIGAIDENDQDTAFQYADVLENKLEEFKKLKSQTNAKKHVQKIESQVEAAIENFKKRSKPASMLNMFNKLKVKRKTRKSRK